MHNGQHFCMIQNDCIHAQNRFAPIFAAWMQRFLIIASILRIYQVVLEDILRKTYRIKARFPALVVNAFPADSRSSQKRLRWPAGVVTQQYLHFQALPVSREKEGTLIFNSWIVSVKLRVTGSSGGSNYANKKLVDRLLTFRNFAVLRSHISFDRKGDS